MNPSRPVLSITHCKHRLSLGHMFAATLLTLALPAVAADFSETLKDAAAGPNTSFELARDGRPLNWSLYTPATTGSNTFTIGVDTQRAKGGKQSLRITSQAPHPKGGRFSPGFFREVPAQAGDVWEVSFHALSTGAEFLAEAGGVSAKQGEIKPWLRWKEQDADWKLHSTRIAIAEGMDRLRLQITVLGVGSVNFDDVVLTRISQRQPAGHDAASAGALPRKLE
jgi:hypothetical protein